MTFKQLRNLLNLKKILYSLHIHSNRLDGPNNSADPAKHQDENSHDLGCHKSDIAIKEFTLTVRNFQMLG